MSQRYAFVDADGILVAHGYVEQNGLDETRLEVPDDFDHVPGFARWTGTEWQAYVPSPPVPSWSPLQFIERFTDAEQLAIVTAAQSSPALRLWYDKAMAAGEIVADDPRTIAGLQVMVDAGLISAERRDQILGS
jgi:hypothetical protein